MVTHFIIYATTDSETGEYYLGRHTTLYPDDGYVGSGNWPTLHPHKARLRTEHLVHYDDDGDSSLTAIYEKRLETLEGEFLKIHFGKPLCRNETDSPRGWTSTNNPMKDPIIVAKLSGDNHWTRREPERVREKLAGDSHWMNRDPEAKQQFLDNHPNKDGRNAKAAIESGRHINLTENHPSKQRSRNGTHQMFRREDGSSIGGDANVKRVEEGTHNWLGPAANQTRIDAGTHNLLGSAQNEKMLAAGTHPSQSETTCLCCRWTVPTSMFKRWHGDNCHMNPTSGRYNPDLKPRIKKKKLEKVVDI